MEDLPVGVCFMDRFGGDALIVSVVPFDEVGIDHGLITEPGDCTGVSRALHRACQDRREMVGRQHGPQGGGDTPPVLGQRNIGRARMLPAQTPGRLAMPDDKYTHFVAAPSRTIVRTWRAIMRFSFVLIT